MSSCLVLGGAGFLGLHLAEALAREGHTVRIFDRPHVDRLQALRRMYEVFTGDFLDVHALLPALRGAEVVFHLISTTLPKSSNDNPVYDAESNLVGTLRLLELCRACRVRRVVYVSSGGTVYGVARSTPVSEDHPTDPLCSYGIHKLAVEKHLALARRSYGLDYCVLRPANLYGPRQRLDIAQGAVGVFLGRALRDEPIELWGDGSVVRDYVYVGDAAEAIVMATRFDGEPRVFNVGSGVGMSLNEVIEAIGRMLGREIRVQRTGARPVDVPVNVLDPSLAQRHLGWRARTPFAEGLRRTCEWLRDAG